MNVIRAAATSLFGMVPIAACESAHADEGGISFWLSGQYGSLAAVPASAGLSFSGIYYHVSEKASQAIPRGGRIDLGVNGHADLVQFGPTWGFEQQIFGGSPTISLTTEFGHSHGSVSGQLTGPQGNTITAYRSDTVTGFSDLSPQVALAWNRGVNNFMTYITGAIPVGAYDKNRLANLGIGHGAIDVGGAYTYLNP